MSGTTVKITGIEDVIANFRKYADSVIPAMSKSVQEGAKVIHFRANSKFVAGAQNSGKYKPPPTRTAQTTHSHVNEQIKWKLDGVGKQYAVAHIGILDVSKEDAIRAISLEYGHNYPRQGRESGAKTKSQAAKSKPVEAHPFMRPAIDESKAEVRAIAKSNIEQAINSVKAKESHP